MTLSSDSGLLKADKSCAKAARMAPTKVSPAPVTLITDCGSIGWAGQCLMTTISALPCTTICRRRRTSLRSPAHAVGSSAGNRIANNTPRSPHLITRCWKNGRRLMAICATPWSTKNDSVLPFDPAFWHANCSNDERNSVPIWKLSRVFHQYSWLVSCQGSVRAASNSSFNSRRFGEANFTGEPRKFDPRAEEIEGRIDTDLMTEVGSLLYVRLGGSDQAALQAHKNAVEYIHIHHP